MSCSNSTQSTDLSGLNLNEELHERFVQCSLRAISQTTVYDGSFIPQSSDAPFQRTVRVRLYREGCLKVCHELTQAYPEDDVLLLSFASGTSPGGMYKGDRRQEMKSQEEYICTKSGLYECLRSERASRFYEVNRSLKGIDKPLQSALLIYSPRVPVILSPSELIAVSIVSVPAVLASSYRMQRKLARYDEVETETIIQKIMTARIRSIFQIAVEHAHRVIVLGAFGCGVFSNSPHIIAQCFSDVIHDFGGYFKEIAFSIIDPRDEVVRPFVDLCQCFEGNISEPL